MKNVMQKCTYKTTVEEEKSKHCIRCKEQFRKSHIQYVTSLLQIVHISFYKY